MEETEQIHHHLTANVHLRKRDIMISNFVGGLSWGFGTVVGATLVVALVVWILHLFNFVPVVGNFASGVLDVINKNQRLR